MNVKTVAKIQKKEQSQQIEYANVHKKEIKWINNR
jgi:hypothetical protein